MPPLKLKVELAEVLVRVSVVRFIVPPFRLMIAVPAEVEVNPISNLGNVAVPLLIVRFAVVVAPPFKSMFRPTALPVKLPPSRESVPLVFEFPSTSCKLVDPLVENVPPVILRDPVVPLPISNPRAVVT